MRFKVLKSRVKGVLERTKARQIKRNEFSLQIDSKGEYPRFHMKLNPVRQKTWVDVHIDIFPHSFAVNQHHLLQELQRQIKSS